MLDEPGLHIIGKIYDAALDCAGWDHTLEAIADYCGGENVALAVIDQHTGYSSITAPRADPAIIAAYTNSWWQFDPTVKATAAIAVGQVTSLDDTGREHFLTSAFHNEFWKQSGLGAERLASNLSVCGNFFASAVLQTSPKRDRIDAEMDLRFRQFVPHLIRSVEMANRYRSLQYENLLGTPARGAPMGGRLVVDADMHLIYADAGGEAFFTGSGCFRFRHGTVALVDRSADRKLAYAVAGTLKRSLVQSHHGSLSVVCGKTQKTVRIDVQPVLSAHMPLGLPFHAGRKPAAILNLGYVQDERQTSIDKLRTRFGLTPAEATVALEMLTGDGREATAQRCGISINTARTHLTRIFDKTGVKRQAELVSVLNGYLGSGLID